MTIKSRFELLLQMVETAPALDHEQPVSRVTYRKEILIPFGSGEGQINLRWSSFITLGIFGSTTLDLVDLTDEVGNPVVFARLCALFAFSAPNPAIPGQSFGTCNLTRPVNGVPFLGAEGDTLNIGARGFGVWIAHRGSPPGVPVTAGTGHLIQIDCGISGMGYDLHLLGVSA